MKNKSLQKSRRRFLAQTAIASAWFIVPRHVLGGQGFVAPSDKISLGFIGAGKQAFGLKNNFIKKERAQVLAISEVYKVKSEKFQADVNKFYSDKNNTDYKGCTIHEDYREILSRKDIDAVVIATPDHWHGVQAVLAAEAGKDIYCEKPLALTIAEGRAMVNATRKHKRVFQTGSMQRSWKEFRQTVQLIQGGFIGDLKTIKVSVGGPPIPYNLPQEPLPDGLNWDLWLGPNEFSHFNNELNPPLTASYWGKWRNFKEFGGGYMTDWGAHMFDIAQWAMNMDEKGPVSIIPPDGKDVKFLTYKYDNGIEMTHENFGTGNAVQFNGTKGKIEVQRGKMITDPVEYPTDLFAQGRVYSTEDHYDDFLTAIQTRKKPICDVETGHRTSTVCTLGNIAYELKRPLKWSYKSEEFSNDKEANAMLTRKLRKGYSIKL